MNENLITEIEVIKYTLMEPMEYMINPDILQPIVPAVHLFTNIKISSVIKLIIVPKIFVVAHVRLS